MVDFEVPAYGSIGNAAKKLDMISGLSLETIDGDGSTTVPVGHGRHIWLNLIPGKTYVFYVRDNNTCTRQSSVNVNDLVAIPMEISNNFQPSCNGANNGEITYTITDDDGLTETRMDWTLYDINDNVNKRKLAHTLIAGPAPVRERSAP